MVLWRPAEVGKFVTDVISTLHKCVDDVKLIHSDTDHAQIPGYDYMSQIILPSVTNVNIAQVGGPSQTNPLRHRSQITDHAQIHRLHVTNHIAMCQKCKHCTSGWTKSSTKGTSAKKNAASKQVHCPLAPFLHLQTGGHSVPGKITTTEIPVRNIGDHKSFATKHRSSREL